MLKDPSDAHASVLSVHPIIAPRIAALLDDPHQPYLRHPSLYAPLRDMLAEILRQPVPQHLPRDMFAELEAARAAESSDDDGDDGSAVRPLPHFPDEPAVSLTAIDLHAAIMRCETQVFREALLCVEAALLQHNPTGVCLSFNGGKDCTVLVHLVRAALAHLALTHGDQFTTDSLRHVLMIYFVTPHEFPEMTRFMSDTERCYGVVLHPLQGSFKQALHDLIRDHPIRVIIMGQRRIDPDAGTSQFKMSI
jgi:hypothetical protein